MTKEEWLKNYKFVVEQEPIEIPLSKFPAFLASVADTDENFEISDADMQEWMERHLRDFDEYTSKKTIKLIEL